MWTLWSQNEDNDVGDDNVEVLFKPMASTAAQRAFLPRCEWQCLSITAFALQGLAFLINRPILDFGNPSFMIKKMWTKQNNGIKDGKGLALFGRCIVYILNN